MPTARQKIAVLATVILGFISFCVETDIYAPSFPDMVQFFGINESYIQHILTANFIGLFFSTLIYGPLSDSLGRKSLLRIGLSIFAMSSIACMFVSSIDYLIGLRFLQGLGAGSITGICTAMVFDIYPKDTSARLITILNSMVTGVMAAAPLVGSWVNIWFGWKMNFAIIAVLAFLAFSSCIFIKETHAPQKRIPLKLSTILNDYYKMLTNANFMSNTLLWTIMFGLVMVFIANLSLIYIEHLHVSEHIFGLYQTSIVAVFFLASLVASQCIAKLGMQKTKIIGNAFFAIGTIGLITMVGFNLLSPLFLTVFMCFCSSGVALACTIYYVNAMADFPDSMGTLAALGQSIRLLMSAAMIAISTKMFTGTMAPIALISAASGIILIILYRISAKEKINKTDLSTATSI